MRTVNTSDSIGKEKGIVVADVLYERKLQDKEWGGAEHDDKHDLDDWYRYIQKHAIRIFKNGDEARLAMIRVAALAIAAAESFDRRTEELLTNKPLDDALSGIHPTGPTP